MFEGIVTSSCNTFFKVYQFLPAVRICASNIFVSALDKVESVFMNIEISSKS